MPFPGKTVNAALPPAEGMISRFNPSLPFLSCLVSPLLSRSFPLPLHPTPPYTFHVHPSSPVPSLSHTFSLCTSSLSGLHPHFHYYPSLSFFPLHSSLLFLSSPPLAFTSFISNYFIILHTSFSYTVPQHLSSTIISLVPSSFLHPHLSFTLFFCSYSCISSCPQYQLHAQTRKTAHNTGMNFYFYLPCSLLLLSV